MKIKITLELSDYQIKMLKVKEMDETIYELIDDISEIVIDGSYELTE